MGPGHWVQLSPAHHNNPGTNRKCGAAADWRHHRQDLRLLFQGPSSSTQNARSLIGGGAAVLSTRWRCQVEAEPRDTTPCQRKRVHRRFTPAAAPPQKPAAPHRSPSARRWAGPLSLALSRTAGERRADSGDICASCRGAGALAEALKK